jgi:hypothetical protein
MPDSIDGVQIKGLSQAGPRGDFVYMTDWAVGKVLKALDSLKISDNTLVLFASDNGAHDFTYRQYGHTPHMNYKGEKADIFEAGHRIPLIIRWPGVVAPNTISTETVCLVDFMATLAAITSFKLPDNAGEDSYSLLPVLLGRTLTAPLREATVHHSNDGLFAIRKGKWKLTPDNMGSGGFTSPKSVDGPGTLYNLETDISETTDRYAARPNDVTQFRALLSKYKTEGRSTPLPRNDEFWNPPVTVAPTDVSINRTHYRTMMHGTMLKISFTQRSVHALEVLSLAGKNVAARRNLAGQTSCDINLRGVSPGMYVLKIQAETGARTQGIMVPSRGK